MKRNALQQLDTQGEAKTPEFKRSSGQTLVLTPGGRLHLEPFDDAPGLDADVAQRLSAAFSRGSGVGLLYLGGGESGTVLPPVFAYWRDFGARYVTALCSLPDVQDRDATFETPEPATPWSFPFRRCEVRSTLPPHCSGRSGGNWTQPSGPNWPRRGCQCRNFSNTSTPPGT